MIQSRLDLLDASKMRSLCSPVKENSIPSKAEITCSKIMGAALIVFGIITVCSFAACLSAAIIMSSAPLAIGAAAVGLIGIGILITSLIAFKKEPEEFLVQGNSVSVNIPVIHTQPVDAHPFVGIVNVNKDQNLRRSVPQYSLSKRPSSGRLQTNISRPSITPTVNGHEIPGSRDISRDTRHIQIQPNVQPSSRDPRQTTLHGNVQVGTR